MDNGVHNHAIDALRLVAALCIVLLHSGAYPEFPAAVGETLRISCRWALPFFYMLSGAYLPSRTADLQAALPARIVRLIGIFVVASALFLPCVFYTQGLVGGLQRILSFSTFRSGSWFHLWFLSSLILGLLCLLAIYTLRVERILNALSVGIVALILITGAYRPFTPDGWISSGMFYFARHLLAIPCLHVGIQLARRLRWSSRYALGAFLAGAALQVIEFRSLRHVFPQEGEPQVLLGSLLMAAGLFGVGQSMSALHPTLLARWGRVHSLGIYLVHPLWLLVFTRVATLAGIQASRIWSLPLAIAVFAASLGLLLVIEHWAPRVKALLDGRIVPARTNGGVEAVE
jgi:surface polysaccharide O-acyltransferase-like enzyme